MNHPGWIYSKSLHLIHLSHVARSIIYSNVMYSSLSVHHGFLLESKSKLQFWREIATVMTYPFEIIFAEASYFAHVLDTC